MLIRWGSAAERQLSAAADNTDSAGEYEMLVAVDRMTGREIASLTFSRANRQLGAVVAASDPRAGEAASRLLRCARNQLDPRGGSFHYDYPSYARASAPDACPVCSNAAPPEGVEEVAELEWSWVSCDRAAQGRLFGKCVVLSKVHAVHLHDLPAAAGAGFMSDLQRTGRALQAVSGAVKINYEIHGNSGPHLHAHLFPRYLDDDFPSAPIDYRLTEPSPYESEEEFLWFVSRMREALTDRQ